MPVSVKTYEQLALEDPEGKWELVDGYARRKPATTLEHNVVALRLSRQLGRQLDEREYDVRPGIGRVRRPSGNHFVPDVFVLPTFLIGPLGSQPGSLEAYVEPLPLVVEVWSPSTGDYDVDEKLPEYQQRGDREIWRLHPHEKTLIAWRRRPDGGYEESMYTGGIVYPAFLPDVAIDLDALFA